VVVMVTFADVGVTFADPYEAGSDLSLAGTDRPDSVTLRSSWDVHSIDDAQLSIKALMCDLGGVDVRLLWGVRPEGRF